MSASIAVGSTADRVPYLAHALPGCKRALEEEEEEAPADDDDSSSQCHPIHPMNPPQPHSGLRDNEEDGDGLGSDGTTPDNTLQEVNAKFSLLILSAEEISG